jgi:hypothetical protein
MSGKNSVTRFGGISLKRSTVSANSETVALEAKSAPSSDGRRSFFATEVTSQNALNLRVVGVTNGSHDVGLAQCHSHT